LAENFKDKYPKNNGLLTILNILQMKKKLFVSLVILPIFGFTQVALNQVDDFEDFTPRNWTKSSSTLPNQNITTGGPLGLNDNFLRVQSPAGGQLVTFNQAQWIGDY
jgi:hypothetical protein